MSTPESVRKSAEKYADQIYNQTPGFPSDKEWPALCANKAFIAGYQRCLDELRAGDQWAEKRAKELVEEWHLFVNESELPWREAYIEFTCKALLEAHVRGVAQERERCAGIVKSYIGTDLIHEAILNPEAPSADGGDRG